MGLLLTLVVLVEDQGMFVFYLGMLLAILFKMCNLLRSSFTSVSGVIGQCTKCQDKLNRVLCDLRGKPFVQIDGSQQELNSWHQDLCM